MTNKTKLFYATHMCRMNCDEFHSYVVYAGDDKEEAIRVGDQEQENRGGNKYYPKVYEFGEFNKETGRPKRKLIYEIVWDYGEEKTNATKFNKRK